MNRRESGAHRTTPHPVPSIPDGPWCAATWHVDWLGQHVPAGATVAVDGHVLGLAMAQLLQRTLAAAKVTLRTDVDLVDEAAARWRSKAITSARGLAIHTRLWNRPTAQPKRQNRCRASVNSSVNTAVAMAMKRAWLGVSVPCSRWPHTVAGGSR